MLLTPIATYLWMMFLSRQDVIFAYAIRQLLRFNPLTLILLTVIMCKQTTAHTLQVEIVFGK